MTTSRPDRERIDDDNHGLTREEPRRARRAAEVLPELIGAKAPKELLRRGRPPKDRKPTTLSSRRRFLQNVFAAISAGWMVKRLAAQEQGGAAVSQCPDLILLPSSVLDEEASRRTMNDVSPINENDRITKILDELRPGITAATRTATRIAGDTRIRVTPGKVCAASGTVLPLIPSPAIRSTLQHALFVLTTTRGTLDTLDDPELAFFLAHELAHQIFYLNSSLRDDPRFQPRSEAFRQELNTAAFNDRQKEQYTNEAMADKLAIWLTRDETAARSALTKGEDMVERCLSPAQHRQAHEERPHPSLNTRFAEIHASFAEAQAQAMSPCRPARVLVL
jgi:hypothetical protein